MKTDVCVSWRRNVGLVETALVSSTKVLQAFSAAGCAPHLGAPGRGGSSHPSQAGGPGCQERPEPANRIQHLSPGAGRVAAGQKGEGAAGLGGRGQRERGAEPEAAAAVNKYRETGDHTKDKWVSWETTTLSDHARI